MGSTTVGWRPAHRRSIHLRAGGHRLHLVPPVVVVLEFAHSPSAGGGLVRLAFGEHGVARLELACAAGRRFSLALVDCELCGLPRHFYLVGDRNLHPCCLSLVRLCLLVHSATVSFSKYGLPAPARGPRPILDHIRYRGCALRRGAYSKSHFGARDVSVGNRFHALV